MYLNDNPKERVWFRYRQEFSFHKVIVVVVISAFCGLKGDVSE